MRRLGLVWLVLGTGLLAMVFAVEPGAVAQTDEDYLATIGALQTQVGAQQTEIAYLRSELDVQRTAVADLRAQATTTGQASAAATSPSAVPTAAQAPNVTPTPTTAASSVGTTPDEGRILSAEAVRSWCIENCEQHRFEELQEGPNKVVHMTTGIGATLNVPVGIAVDGWACDRDFDAVGPITATWCEATFRLI